MSKLFTKLIKQVKGIKIAHEKAIKKEVKEKDKEQKELIFLTLFDNLNPNLFWFHRIDDKANKGEWRVFNNETGCHDLYSKSKVKKCIFQFCVTHKKSPQQFTTKMYEYLQSFREEDPTEYDLPHLLLISNKKVIDSNLNKIVDFDSAVHKFTKMENRNIVEIDPYSEAIIDNLMNIVTTQHHVKTARFPFGDDSAWQKEKLIQSITNMIWGFQSDKQMLCFVGPPNAAKTVLINVLSSMFKNYSGAFDLRTLGENGGLNNIYNKRIGFQNECNGGWFLDKNASKFKDLMSNLTKMSVRLLYNNPFDVEINCQLILAANQLPKLPYSFESDSMFKRFLILYTPNFFKKSIILEDLLSDDEFLDIFFSYFIGKKPKSTIGDLEEDIRRSEKYYNWSSRPIDRIINNNYIRDYENIDGLIAATVYQTVEAKLRMDHVKIPKSLTELVNKSVMRLGGVLRRNKKIENGVDYNGDLIYERHDCFIGISLKIMGDDSTFISEKTVEILGLR